MLAHHPYRLWYCGEIARNPRWRMAPHRHANHHELIVVLDGEMLLRTAGGELVARAGDVLCYPAGLTHEEISQPRDPVRTLFIAFSSRSAAPLSLPLRATDADGRVKQLAWWLVQDRHRHRPAADGEALLAALLAELCWRQSNPRDPWLEELTDWLRVNCAKKLTLSEIARHARMSRFAFIRKFKRLAGRTPMAELRRLRLLAARDLLLSSNLPLKAIAPRAGLGDEYQCSKLFRRHFGLSPRQLRGR
ncbi:MAG: AraC family transcriptional regulator [Verrucomicrobiales bacterium]|jgi:AraC-like DNA-binding protein|nr:AraC family transcriptional regulator [Verrucomicrobiales bacterium]